jgi:Ca2+-binding EF-hand superfamily protein
MFECLRLILDRKQFLIACSSGKMNRKQFYKFYRTLRVESDDKVKEIANFVFTAFDRDSNGKIDFTEFLCMFDFYVSMVINWRV